MRHGAPADAKGSGAKVIQRRGAGGRLRALAVPLMQLPPNEAFPRMRCVQDASPACRVLHLFSFENYRRLPPALNDARSSQGWGCKR